MSSADKSRKKTANSFKIDISKFKAIKKLKSGGFGSIYEAKDIQTKKIYAAKVSKHLDDEENEISKKMINREIRIMMLFQHPTIINFYGYSLIDFKGEHRVTIIMDLAQKGSLFDVLKKARDGFADENYDNTARQIILTGVARGMMFLHQHNVIHRDLKAANILLDEYFRPHITDFGLSKFYEMGQDMVHSLSVGTSYYMAPEVIQGQRYNGKADVYSFGIIMYEVLTESIPYPLLEDGSLSQFEFTQKVAYQNYRPVFKVPVKKSFRKLIKRCWSEDPNERPTFEEIFNKLAFNIENSIYDVLEENDIEKKFEIDYEKEDDSEDENNEYYLKDLDIDEFLCYIDEIAQSDIKEDKSSYRAAINNLQKDKQVLSDQVNECSNQIKQLTNQIAAFEQQMNETFEKQLQTNDQTQSNLKNCEKELKSIKKRI